MHATPPNRSNRFTWRVVDIVVAAVLGVASSVVFLASDLIYYPLAGVLAFTPGLVGATAGLWLFAGVLGGLIIRKPGAAFFVAVVATLIEMAVWNTWGLPNLLLGAFQGLGAEIAVAVFLYKSSRIWVALLGGALAAVANAVLSFLFYFPAEISVFYVTYLVAALASGLVIGGVVPWLIMRGLVRAGALNRFPVVTAS